jgi:putative membrane protein
MFVISLVPLALYAIGVLRLWRVAGWGHGITKLETLAFTSGSLAILVALSGPIDEWSETSLSVHMVQHELLMVIAAPLMAASRPLIAWLWLLPTGPRRAMLRAVLTRPITRTWGAITAPLSVFLLHAAALWIWHLPVLYDTALEHEWIHLLQHTCFFGSAALFWWGIAHGRYGRMGYGAAVVYVFATAVHGGALGALMSLSPRIWYAPYLTTGTEAFTALQDQQLAGILMWVPAGLVLAAAGLAFFAAWLRESERRTRFRPATPAQGSPS